MKFSLITSKTSTTCYHGRSKHIFGKMLSLENVFCFLTNNLRTLNDFLEVNVTLHYNSFY